MAAGQIRLAADLPRGYGQADQLGRSSSCTGTGPSAVSECSAASHTAAAT